MNTTSSADKNRTVQLNAAAFLGALVITGAIVAGFGAVIANQTAKAEAVAYSAQHTRTYTVEKADGRTVMVIATKRLPAQLQTLGTVAQSTSRNEGRIQLLGNLPIFR